MTNRKALKAADAESQDAQSPQMRRQLESYRHERNLALAQLLEVRTESQVRIASLEAATQQLEETRASERSAFISQIVDRDNRLAQLQTNLNHSARVTAGLNQAVAELNQAVADLERRVMRANEHLRRAKATIATLQSSTSWRITAPLRFLKRGINRIKPLIRDWLRAFYLVIPLPVKLKIGLKAFFFALLSPLLHHTETYRAWVEHEKSRTRS